MALVQSGYQLVQIRCDEAGCVERFNSYSDKSIVPTQAQLAGWTIVEGKRTKHGKQADQHYCTAHKPRSVMTAGPVPQDVARAPSSWDAAVTKSRAR